MPAAASTASSRACRYSTLPVVCGLVKYRPQKRGACPIVSVALLMSAGVTGKAVSAPTIDMAAMTPGGTHGNVPAAGTALTTSREFDP